MPRDRDDSARLLAAVTNAVRTEQPLSICGRGSKTFLRGADGRRHAGRRRSLRRRRLRAERTRHHRARRHAARRHRQVLAEHGQMMAFDPPTLCRRRQPRRCGRARSLRPGASVVRRRARRGARCHVDQRPRAAAEVRRVGDEERRRVRRLPLDGGCVRHARRVARRQHQGLAASAIRIDACIRARSGRGTSPRRRVGAIGVAAVGYVPRGRHAARAAFGAEKGVRSAVARIGGDEVSHASEFWAFGARPDARVLSA